MGVEFRLNSTPTQGAVNLGSPAALSPSPPWSVMGWVNYTSASPPVQTIYTGSAAGQPMLAWGDGLTVPWVAVAGTTTSERAGDTEWITNEWLFYIGTFDGTDLRLYRGYDGSFTLRNTLASSNPTPVTGSSYLSRRWDNPAHGLQGQLAHVAVFDSLLSLSDGSALYGARSSSASFRTAVLAKSPIAYWTLNEASPSTANDEVGTLDGTYVNTEYSASSTGWDYRLRSGNPFGGSEGWGMVI